MIIFHFSTVRGSFDQGKARDEPKIPLFVHLDIPDLTIGRIGQQAKALRGRVMPVKTLFGTRPKDTGWVFEQAMDEIAADTAAVIGARSKLGNSA